MVDRSSPRYLEVSHIAHRLSVSPEYVLRLIRAKKLPAFRLGKRYRVNPVDLEAYLDAQRVPSEEPKAQLHAVPSNKGA